MRKGSVKMTIDELKQEIGQRTGIPGELLTGENAEELIAQSKALLALKRDSAPKTAQEMTPREQFSQWFDAASGADPEETTTPELTALANLEEQLRVSNGGYPIVTDGGEVSRLASRTAREAFNDWIGSKLSWDPAKGVDGWKRLL